MVLARTHTRLVCCFAVLGGCVADPGPLTPEPLDGGDVVSDGGIQTDGGRGPDGGIQAACATEFAALPAFETREDLGTFNAFTVVHRTRRDCLLFSMTMTVASPGWVADWELNVCNDCPVEMLLHTFGTSRDIEEMRGFEDASGVVYLECPKALDPLICSRADVCDVPNEPRVPKPRTIELGVADERRLTIGIFNGHGFATSGDWRKPEYLDDPELQQCDAWEVAPERPAVTADIASPLRLVYTLPGVRLDAPARAPVGCLNNGFGVPASCGWPVVENEVVDDVVRTPSFELPSFIPDQRR